MRKDETGKKFGRLTAIKAVSVSSQRSIIWECVCECGNIVNVTGNVLRSGNSKSCGCLQKDIVRQQGLNNFKHGLIKTRSYSVWTNMKNRCFNKDCKEFSFYGGRGITVCDRWKNDFSLFWEDMGEKPKNKSLDRIDTNGNYEPQNCRWATAKEQARNTRGNKYFYFKKKMRSMAEISEISGVSYSTLRWRLMLGHWDVLKATKTKLVL